VLLHVALPEKDGSIHVDAGRDEDRDYIEDVLREQFMVIRHGDRVQVDDAVDGLSTLLAFQVPSNCAKIVTKVLCACRLDPLLDEHEVAEMRMRLQPLQSMIDSALERLGLHG
jgi:hypothetical protein